MTHFICWSHMWSWCIIQLSCSFHILDPFVAEGIYVLKYTQKNMHPDMLPFILLRSKYQLFVESGDIFACNCQGYHSTLQHCQVSDVIYGSPVFEWVASACLKYRQIGHHACSANNGRQGDMSYAWDVLCTLWDSSCAAWQQHNGYSASHDPGCRYMTIST